jgi:hypothetical protein
MTWPESDGFQEPAGGDLEDGSSLRWPLDWRGLYPRERWRWFEQPWTDVCALRDRYRLPVRRGWWEHPVQVEALVRAGRLDRSLRLR